MLKNYRWTVALLLFVAGSINYMDRAAIGVVAPFIQKSFTLTPSQLGLTFSTFFIGYAVFAFVGGQLADRFGPVRTQGFRIKRRACGRGYWRERARPALHPAWYGAWNSCP